MQPSFSILQQKSCLLLLAVVCSGVYFPSHAQYLSKQTSLNSSPYPTPNATVAPIVPYLPSQDSKDYMPYRGVQTESSSRSDLRRRVGTRVRTRPSTSQHAKQTSPPPPPALIPLLAPAPIRQRPHSHVPRNTKPLATAQAPVDAPMQKQTITQLSPAYIDPPQQTVFAEPTITPEMLRSQPLPATAMQQVQPVNVTVSRNMQQKHSPHINSTEQISHPARMAAPHTPQTSFTAPSIAQSDGNRTNVTIFEPEISPLPTRDALLHNAQITAPAETTVEPAQLSGQTKAILASLPQDLFPDETATASGNVALDRNDPLRSADDKVNFNTSPIGANINVVRQSLDVNYELEKAYNALLRGNTSAAITSYKDVLTVHPRDKNALFGLATTYQRLDMLEQARPLYATLLEIDPYNREVLNNFLGMVGQEAPESAIAYLEQLKRANNDFSPIYAQLAQIYERTDKLPNAVMNMEQAVDLEPTNLLYLYNLAVLYDTAGEQRRAEVLYRKLLRFELNGQDIPASNRDIQERLTFLSSN